MKKGGWELIGYKKDAIGIENIRENMKEYVGLAVNQTIEPRMEVAVMKLVSSM